MATTSNVEVTISLIELGLDEDELQTEVQNLLPQIKDVDGVEDANLVAVTEAPQGAKAFGGFSLGTLKAVVNPALIKPLFGFLGRVLGNKTIKVGIKVTDGRELNLEASSREDLEFARQLAEDFVNKTNIQNSNNG
ncbi:sugar ABC transporter permease [Nostocaceae cyanobacterium CENA357]|uniref:Sugar ABC transporter permease n=1 Tax=Atlanticothrix silvestris CENA357 TaxID=1725252 RepID=A0A8J7L4P5_9CYAN|nr:sugar ABC transporter permease [Atlanticothrix silvestris]MBH8556205.1 sugar ABC transporter permease [Atlanticothrix silvestris CENA357]